jgi:hypothetical protein
MWLGTGKYSTALWKRSGTLTPTHGNLSSDRPFEEKNPERWSNYSSNRDFYDPQATNGIEIQKSSTTAPCAVNMEFIHDGSQGFTIPASLIRSVAFETQRMNNANSNWRVHNIGLEFENFITGSKRLYTPGWEKGIDPADPNPGYTIECFNGESHFNTIRSWGPDWGLKAVIANVRSDRTAGPQSPRLRLYHLKIGWEGGVSTPLGGPEVTSDIKIVRPQSTTFAGYGVLYRQGKMAYK